MTTTSSAPSSSAADGRWETSRPRSTPSSAREAATAGSGSTVAGLAETALTRPLERWASRAAAMRLRPSSATPRKTTTRAGRAPGRPFPPPGTATSRGGVPARSLAAAASDPVPLIPTTAPRQQDVSKKTPQQGSRFHADLRRCCHFGDTGPVARLSAVGGGCCSTRMRRFGVEERRARLGLRHHLAGTAKAGVVEAARDLVGLHGTDPATVYLAARARMRDPQVAAVERALYDDRALVRLLGMRRTMFVEPVELMGVVQGACTDAIAVQQRRLLADLIGRAGMADDPAGWIEDVEKATVKALEARGGANAPQGAKDHPPPAPQI